MSRPTDISEVNGQPVAVNERDLIIDQQKQMIEELNHFIMLQGNTIAAFQNRVWKLEMELVDLMTKVPQPAMEQGEDSDT